MDPVARFHGTSSQGYIVAVGFLNDFSSLMVFNRNGTVSYVKFLPRLTQRSASFWQIPITTVAFAEDFPKVFIGDEKGNVFAITKQAEICSRVYHRQSFRITSIRIAPDYQSFLCASEDRSIKLFRTSDLGPISSFYGHQGSITGICFTTDGESFVTSCTDKKIRIFQLSAPACSTVLVSYSVAPSSLLCHPSGLIIVSLLNGTISVLGQGQQIRVEKPHVSSISAMELHSSSRFLLAASADNTLSVADLGGDPGFTLVNAHAAVVTGVVWSPDQVHFASVDAAGELFVWEFPEAFAVVPKPVEKRGRGSPRNTSAFAPKPVPIDTPSEPVHAHPAADEVEEEEEEEEDIVNDARADGSANSRKEPFEEEAQFAGDHSADGSPSDRGGDLDDEISNAALGDEVLRSASEEMAPCLGQALAEPVTTAAEEEMGDERSASLSETSIPDAEKSTHHSIPEEDPGAQSAIAAVGQESGTRAYEASDTSPAFAEKASSAGPIPPPDDEDAPPTTGRDDLSVRSLSSESSPPSSPPESRTVSATSPLLELEHPAAPSDEDRRGEVVSIPVAVDESDVSVPNDFEKEPYTTPIDTAGPETRASDRSSEHPVGIGHPIDARLGRSADESEESASIPVKERVLSLSDTPDSSPDEADV
jgi:hypothetical protein